MKVLSLFDGISCARVALDRAGIPVEAYYASEVDRYAMQISKKNYPDIQQLGSVVGLNVLPTNIDLLIGGSPCQDLSIAKKDRKGLDGERSGLFWEYVRILKEVKPKYFILENVNSMPKEAKEIITQTLGVDPIMINASLVSAQNRKRLFWTNIPNVTQPEDRGILLKDILEPEVDEKYFVHSDNWRVKRNTVDFEGKSRCLNASNFKGALNDEMSLMRVGQIGKGGQGDRIYSTEGKSVGLSAQSGGTGPNTGLYCVGNVNPSGRGMNGFVYDAKGKAPNITTNKGEGSKILIEKDSFVVPVAQRGRNIVDGKRKDILGARTEQRIEIGQSDKAHTITSVSKDSMVMQDTQIRKLTPIECERLQGLPDNYTEGVSNSQRYKMLGNAFNVDVVSHILSFIDKPVTKKDQSMPTKSK